MTTTADRIIQLLAKDILIDLDTVRTPLTAWGNPNWKADKDAARLRILANAEQLAHLVVKG